MADSASGTEQRLLDAFTLAITSLAPILGGSDILFGSGAITAHAIRLDVHHVARPPGDIDLWCDSAATAARLVGAGYVRTGACEFRTVDDVQPFPVQLWDWHRPDQPCGASTGITHFDNVRVGAETLRVTSLLSLFKMKRQLLRVGRQKVNLDRVDLVAVRTLLSVHVIQADGSDLRPKQPIK